MISEQQEKLLKRVEELFLRYGIKSLTMDDVARELGISKKTLYQFVDNKDDLVLKVMERHIHEDCQQAEALRAESNDALDEILKVIQYNAVDLGRMKSNIVFEMQRFYPAAWEKMEQFTWEFMYKIVLDNLEWGIRDGLYRADFDADIMARMHIATMLQLFDERIFPKPPYSLEKLFKEYMEHYLYGIISEKGSQILKAKLS
ncbi:MAG: TetR/AcrR family transcriptional regulator [Saprospiraceae bacterium]|nr:TetR/AcrR family transcriptional regulator [Saprospiraceae bacterium]